jgi:branched-chain amino acid transport system permease protein
MGAFNLIGTEQAARLAHAAGQATGLPVLQEVDLSSSKFLIYGLALVLMMALRPEGLFPSRQRSSELHETGQIQSGAP